jgi:hypothetical protein
MDMESLAGTCFSVGANVVFIFNGGKKHHLGTFVKEFFARQILLLKACRPAEWW